MPERTNPFDLARLVPLDHLRSVEQISGAPAWLMATTAVVMFAAWTGCYYTTIRQGFRDRTYGIPIVNTALNISWEFIFAFDLLGPLPSFFFPLKWGHRIWLIFDVFNVLQIVKYGRAAQPPAVQQWFYPIVALTLLVCGPGIYLFMSYFNDLHGVAAATIIDVLMGVLFIGLYLKRPALQGLSYAAAWLRTVGDVASFVFLYYWWPAQFANGVLRNPEGINRFNDVQEPQSFLFLYFLFAAATLLDLFYVYLLYSRRKALRNGTLPPASPDAASA